jgi:hypothetical protein
VVTTADQPGSFVVPAVSTTGAYSLTWTVPAIADGFEIEESTTGTFTGAPTYTLPTAVPSFDFTGKAPGTYYYRIRATQDGLIPSDWVSGSVAGCNVPDADGDGVPDGLDVCNGDDATGDTDVDLTCNDLDTDDDGDGLPDAWEITYTLDPLDATGINGAAGDPDADSLTNAGELAAGTDPRNPDTDGDTILDSADLAPLVADALPPTGVIVPATSTGNQVLIQWSGVTTPGATYVVEELLSDGVTVNQTSPELGGTSYVFTNDVQGGVFFYRVKAVAAGYTESGWVVGGDSCTVILQVEQPSAFFVPASSTTGNFTLTWTNPVQVDGFEIEESTTGSFTGTPTYTLATAVSSFEVTGRTPGTYSYRIRGTKGGLISSDWVTGGVIGCNVPDADGDGVPDGLDVCNGNDATGDTDSDLTCNDLDSDDDGDGLPDAWEITYSLDPLDATGINGAAGDPDEDGLDNAGELISGTDPRDADTDGDKIIDGLDPNPLIPDSAVSGATLSKDRSSPVPVNSGDVVFTATGQGGIGIYEYQFYVNNVVQQAYSSKSTFIFSTNRVFGYYQVKVFVRNAGSTSSMEAYAYTSPSYYLFAAASGATLTPDRISPLVENNGNVVFTAKGQGGAGNYEYQFYVNNVLQQAYSPIATYDFDTNRVFGYYQVKVFVRNAGSTSSMEAYAYTSPSYYLMAGYLDSDKDGLINTAEVSAGTNPLKKDTDGDGIIDGVDPNPLLPDSAVSGANLSSDRISPVVENSGNVVFSATGQGGVGSYEYQFYVNNVVQQAYSPISTFIFDTNRVFGYYQVKVFVRNAGSTSSMEAYAYTSPSYYLLAGNVDTDSDGLTNTAEVSAGTNPLVNDTDGDNVIDGFDPNPLIFDSAASGVALSPDRSSPVPISSGDVLFTATGQGGIGSYEYQFYLNNELQQAYSPVSIFIFDTNRVSGYYQVKVFVRNAGSKSSMEAYAYTSPKYLLNP